MMSEYNQREKLLAALKELSQKAVTPKEIMAATVLQTFICDNTKPPERVALLRPKRGQPPVS